VRRWLRRDLDARVERLPLQWAAAAHATTEDKADVEARLKAS
jgi:hypothetical protein